MCSYCGCESESVVDKLMADHEQIGLLARRAELVLRQGDPMQTDLFPAALLLLPDDA